MTCEMTWLFSLWQVLCYMTLEMTFSHVTYMNEKSQAISQNMRHDSWNDLTQ